MNNINIFLEMITEYSSGEIIFDYSNKLTIILKLSDELSIRINTGNINPKRIEEFGYNLGTRENVKNDSITWSYFSVNDKKWITYTFSFNTLPNKMSDNVRLTLRIETFDKDYLDYQQENYKFTKGLLLKISSLLMTHSDKFYNPNINSEIFEK